MASPLFCIIYFVLTFVKLTVKQDVLLCQQPLHTSAYVPWQQEAAVWGSWYCVGKHRLRLPQWCNPLPVHIPELSPQWNYLQLYHHDSYHRTTLIHTAPETLLASCFLITRLSPHVQIIVSAPLTLPSKSLSYLPIYVQLLNPIFIPYSSNSNMARHSVSLKLWPSSALAGFEPRRCHHKVCHPSWLQFSPVAIHYPGGCQPGTAARMLESTAEPAHPSSPAGWFCVTHLESTTWSNHLNSRLPLTVSSPVNSSPVSPCNQSF